MGASTEISWCDKTWSPVWGCTEVSPACTNCYARTLAHRFGYGWNGEPMREFGDHHWNEPLRWNKRAAAAGRHETVFPSMCDPFDKDWPAGIRTRFFKLMVNTPNLTWLLLTKRIGNAEHMLNEAALEYTSGLSDWTSAPLPNVWLGSTVINQEEADRDIPKLLATPARIRFLSIEPMLGPIDLTLAFAVREVLGPPLLSWTICGAESGPKARSARLDWMRSIVQQCRGAGVPVHVKQLGREVFDDGMSSPGGHWPAGIVRRPLARRAESDPSFVIRLEHAKGGDDAEWPDDLRVREFPT